MTLSEITKKINIRQSVGRAMRPSATSQIINYDVAGMYPNLNLNPDMDLLESAMHKAGIMSRMLALEVKKQSGDEYDQEELERLKYEHDNHRKVYPHLYI